MASPSGVRGEALVVRAVQQVLIGCLIPERFVLATICCYFSGLGLGAHCTEFNPVAFEGISDDSSVSEVLVLTDSVLRLSMELPEGLVSPSRLGVNVRVLALLLALVLLELGNTLLSVC